MIEKRIQKLLKEKGMNIHQLAKATNIGDNTIKAWENGNPKMESIIKVANFFDVSIDYLLGRSNKSKLDAEELLPDRTLDLIRLVETSGFTDKQVEIIMDYINGAKCFYNK